MGGDVGVYILVDLLFVMCLPTELSCVKMKERPMLYIQFGRGR